MDVKMESGRIPVDEATNNSPLLPEVDGGQGGSTSASATALLVLSTFVATTGSCVLGSAVGFSSPAQPGILKDFGRSLSEYSFFGSILTVGVMIGAVGSGKITDLYGRKGAMGLAELFDIFGWITMAFAKNAWWLDTGRLSTGFGIGLLSYVPVYIAEISPKNLRGALAAANPLMLCFGTCIMFLVGNYISWRALALIGSIPCLLHLLGLFFIPESPSWLAQVGKWDDTEKSLARLGGKNIDIFEEAAAIRDYMRTPEQLKDSRIMDLFRRKYAHSLIVGVGLMVLQQFGGVNAINYYATSITAKMKNVPEPQT